MENGIKELKQEYIAITPPLDLTKSGAYDLWSRIDNKKQISKKHYAQILACLLLIVIISTLVGIKSSQAKEGNVLYPVKILTAKSITAISKTPAIKFYNSHISSSKSPKKIDLNNSIIQVSPSASPITPTIKIEPTISKNNKKFENENENKSENNKNQNIKTEDVKGINTFNDHSENQERKNIQNEESNHFNDKDNNNQSKANKEQNNNGDEGKEKN